MTRTATRSADEQGSWSSLTAPPSRRLLSRSLFAAVWTALRDRGEGQIRRYCVRTCGDLLRAGDVDVVDLWNLAHRVDRTPPASGSRAPSPWNVIVPGDHGCAGRRPWSAALVVSVLASGRLLRSSAGRGAPRLTRYRAGVDLAVERRERDTRAADSAVMRLIIRCHATSVASSVLMSPCSLLIWFWRSMTGASCASCATQLSTPDPARRCAVDFALRDTLLRHVRQSAEQHANAAAAATHLGSIFAAPHASADVPGAGQQVDDGADAGAAERETDRGRQVRIEARQLLVGEADVAERDELAHGRRVLDRHADERRQTLGQSRELGRRHRSRRCAAAATSRAGCGSSRSSCELRRAAPRAAVRSTCAPGSRARRGCRLRRAGASTPRRSRAGDRAPIAIASVSSRPPVPSTRTNRGTPPSCTAIDGDAATERHDAFGADGSVGQRSAGVAGPPAPTSASRARHGRAVG